MKNLGKIFSVVLLLFSLCSNVSSASVNLEPHSKACQPFTSYSESSIAKSQSQQFTHIVYSSPVSSTVSYEVTFTSTFSLKAGISSD